jgi:hypothetical protein
MLEVYQPPASGSSVITQPRGGTSSKLSDWAIRGGKADLVTGVGMEDVW